MDRRGPSGRQPARAGLELRDGDRGAIGQGVTKAVAHINGEIASALSGREPDQRAIDQALIDLDGTPNKGRLGANAILGVSMALARAAAAAAGVPLYVHLAALDGASGGRVLPVPMMNILNGGAHADSSWTSRGLVMPVAAAPLTERRPQPPETPSSHASRHPQGAGAIDRGLDEEVCAHLSSNQEALDVVLEAITKRYAHGGDIYIALDGAASELWNEDERRYEFRKSGEAARTADQMVALFEDWVRQYPIISIEDGLAESDWDGWRALTQALGARIQLVGDDIFVTNPEILARGISASMSAAILVKLNQIGTLSETSRPSPMARRGRVRQRDFPSLGRDQDTTIATWRCHRAGQIKTGAASRTDRGRRSTTSSCAIEEELGLRGRYRRRAAIKATF